VANQKDEKLKIDAAGAESEFEEDIQKQEKQAGAMLKSSSEEKTDMDEFLETDDEQTVKNLEKKYKKNKKEDEDSDATIDDDDLK